MDGVLSSAEATIAFEEPHSAVGAAAALDGTDVGGQPITASVKRALLVGSKVKEVVREAGLRSDRELVEALSDKVHEILAGAIDRCRSNHRSTVRPYDL